MDSNTEDGKGVKEFIATLTGRRVVIHFHHPKDTLPPGTLLNFLAGTKWNEDDLRRLGLIF